MKREFHICWNAILKKTKSDALVLTNLVIERGNAVSVSPITGKRSNFPVVYLRLKGNEPTIVRSADLSLKINESLERWNVGTLETANPIIPLFHYSSCEAKRN